MEERTAKHMLEVSVQIYEQVRQSYNQTFCRPIYKFPGFVMGFRII